MKTSAKWLSLISTLLCQVICSAQVAVGYKEKAGHPQANYYSIASEVDSLLRSMPVDSSEENASVLFARWKWFWDSRMGDAVDQAKMGKFSGYVDAMKSLVQTPSCTSPSSYPANWNLLGPVQLPRQEMGWIHSVARDPNNASVVYAGAPNGGLWRTNDVNASVPIWENITDHTHLPGLGVGDILIDPSNSDVIYLATGFYTSGIGYGVGVLKTVNGTDALPTWEFTGVNYNPFVNEVSAVKRLVMSPVDNQTVYAFTGKEVFKTTDGGASWPSMGLNAAVANDDLDIANLVIDPLDLDNIIVTTTRFDDNVDMLMGDLWRWDNTALTWTQLTVNLSASPLQHAYSRYPLLLSTANSDIYTMYKSSVDTRIDKSTDGGVTWSLHTATNNYGPLFIVSPLNSSIMYLGDGSGRVVYKSIDGGADFDPISNYWPENFYNGTSTHADIRALQLFQASTDGLSDILLAGTDGGVLYSSSAQAPLGNVVNWTNINGYGLAVGQFYGLAGSEREPGRIVAGAQDNGFATHEYGAWVNKVVGDSYKMVIDRENSLQAIGEKIGYGGQLASGTYLGKSVTGGQTWTGSMQQPPWGNPSNQGNFNQGVQYSPDVWNVKDQPILINQQNDLFIGFHDLFKFDTSNSSWNPVSDFTAEGVAIGAGCNALAIAQSDPNVIYFGYEHQTWDPNNLTKKKLWRTLNGGSSWTDVTNDLPVNYAGISGIAIDPDDSDRVWVSFNSVWHDGNLAEPYNGINRVYYSHDGGTTWTDYSLGLTSLPINTITYEQGSNDGIYVGTDVGVFYTNRVLYNSDDVGNPQNTGWVCFNDGFPVCVVTQVEVNYASNRLRASTYGRGIWESTLACPLTADLLVTTVSANGLSSTFQEVLNNISITADVGDIQLTDLTARAGNEISVSASGSSGVLLGPGSHLYIHPCDAYGNSFAPKAGPVGQIGPNDDTGFADLWESGIRAYPNPTPGAFTVEVAPNDEGERQYLSVVDAMGRIVASASTSNGKAVFDLSGRRGMFLIYAEGEEGRMVTRVIIE